MNKKLIILAVFLLGLAFIPLGAASNSVGITGTIVGDSDGGGTTSTGDVTTETFSVTPLNTDTGTFAIGQPLIKSFKVIGNSDGLVSVSKADTAACENVIILDKEFEISQGETKTVEVEIADTSDQTCQLTVEMGEEKKKVDVPLSGEGGNKLNYMVFGLLLVPVVLFVSFKYLK